MPAPERQIGDSVVARDGTKARVVAVYDFGEDAPAEYDIQTEKGEVIEGVAEDFIAIAPEPTGRAKVVPTKTATVDAGAEAAPVQDGGEGGVA